MDLEDGEVEDESPPLVSARVSWSPGPQSHVTRASGNWPLPSLITTHDSFLPFASRPQTSASCSAGTTSTCAP